MLLDKAAHVLKCCPRCHGPLCSSYYSKDFEEYSCLYCGEYVYTPALRNFGAAYRDPVANCLSQK
jgi:hypothetical protein